jgi:hypothetical protein
MKYMSDAKFFPVFCLDNFNQLDGIFVRKKCFIDKKSEGAADMPVALPCKASADHPASHVDLHLHPVHPSEANKTWFKTGRQNFLENLLPCKVMIGRVKDLKENRIDFFGSPPYIGGYSTSISAVDGDIFITPL